MSANSVNNATFGTVGMSTGQWYFEGRLDTAGGLHPFIGISSQIGISNAQNTTNFGQSGTGVYKGSGTLSAGDIVGVAVSFTSAGVGSTVTFYVNGSIDSSGTGHRDRFDGKENTWIPGVSLVNAGVWSINFGQNPTFSGTVTAGTYTDGNGKGLFKYQPPSGFLALCEDNLPTPAIADPGKYFKSVLWTGDDSNSMKITGIGFKPDLVWVKKRTGGSQNHTLYDSVRGADKRLMPNVTNAESSVTDYMRSFDNDGFSIGGNNFVNDVGQNYVAWCWKAGGAAVSNTDGSITSQVSANQDAGFSIVSYTGTGASGTIGHGLSNEPEFVIIKDIDDGSYNWVTYHKDYTNSQYIQKINLDDEEQDAGGTYALTRGSSTLGVLGGLAINTSGNRYISYCWHSVEGFSKIGSYEGNGNADGPFVYCGFKPAWVMVKNIDDTGGRDWGTQDSSRKSTNPCDKHLKANSTEVENSGLADSTFQIDMLSNGFKVRNNTGIWNNSGETIIFMAFAESPFQTANAK